MVSGRRCGIYQQCRDIGRDCCLAGLVSSHAGNLSLRRGDRMIITRRGAMLGRLRPDDLLETGVEPTDAAPVASTETPTHRAIYSRTPAQAILHTHSPHGVALSFDQDEIVALDAEGAHLFGQVPVVVAERPVGSEEMARVISLALVDHRLCMLRGHGLFAAGGDLEEAYRLSSAFEASARAAYLVRVARITPVKKERHRA